MIEIEAEYNKFLSLCSFQLKFFAMDGEAESRMLRLYFLTTRSEDFRIPEIRVLSF